MMQITTRVPKMYKVLCTKCTSLLEEALQHVSAYQNGVSCFSEDCVPNLRKRGCCIITEICQIEERIWDIETVNRRTNPYVFFYD